MRKVISNILMAVIVIISSYLIVANILSLFYVRDYEKIDFDNEVMKEIYVVIKELEDLNENIQSLTTTKLSNDDLKTLKFFSEDSLTKIKENKILTYKGIKKIYSKDILNIAYSQGMFQSILGNYLNMLERNDESIKEFNSFIKNSWIKDLYAYDELFKTANSNYKYNTLSFHSYEDIFVRNTKGTALIYRYNYELKLFKILLNMGLEIGGVNYE